MKLLGKTKKQMEANSLGLLFSIMCVLYLVTVFVISIVPRDLLTTRDTLIISESLILVPGIIYLLIRRLNFFEAIGLKKIKIGTFFMTLLVGVLFNFIASFVNILSQFLVPNTMTQASGSLMSDMSTATLLIMSGVFGPLCEELIFRGIFAKGYEKAGSVCKAIVVSSLLFGLFHMNLNQFCYAFVLGMLFALLNKASGSIITSCIVHMLINLYNVGLIILTNYLYSMAGVDATSVATEAENLRSNTASMVSMASVYGVIATVAIILAYICIKWIARHEGNLEEFSSIFKKSNSEVIEKVTDDDTSAEEETVDSKDRTRVVLNIPLMIGILISAGFILLDIYLLYK